MCRPVLFSVVLALFNFLLAPELLPAQETHASPSRRAIVVGFLGGFVGHNNSIHNEVRLAKKLSTAYPSTVEVRTFENHRGKQAHSEILRLLDANRDGTLSPLEKRQARIAIYGHSWGASETVTLARELEHDGIPVLLTVQVDSVRKPGQDDARIPANVLDAVNFYQSDGLLHGRSLIEADDASRTTIVGNFRFDYKSKPVACPDYPWFARTFMKPHIEIESDPIVWGQVETFIRAKLQLDTDHPNEETISLNR